MTIRLFLLLLFWLPAAAHEAPAQGAAQSSNAPILVLVDAANPFSRYYTEILLAEGLNSFTTKEVSALTASTLQAHDVVILGEMPLTGAQVAVLTDWVGSGGSLIAMRPDKKLAGLLGLGDVTATILDAYLRIDTSSGPGAGLVDQTIPFHGSADCYTLRGASAIATLYLDAALAGRCPAVTHMPVGDGHAAAFTFDLARSVVYTRQGNPEWSGNDRDGMPPTRSADLYFGNGAERRAREWIDMRKVSIPGADEQQRLLANLVITMNLGRMPLPRFWYFPRGRKAVVIMTGDDHGLGGTAGRFDAYKARSTPGCSVADWECVRGTSYVYPGTPLTDAQAAAYMADGFEVALHVDTECRNWTAESLEASFAAQIASWRTAYPSLPLPTTGRTHCAVWSDYSTQPRIELRHGIRLDTNYYYYPAAWMADQPGVFTGSGMPMRFAAADGTTIDVYQATTQMTDESGQAYPETVDALLDRALGPEGYYGAFTANIHTDSPVSDASDAIVAAAQARGVPVVSARQMLEWLDGRNRSSFADLSMSGNTLRFTVDSPLGGSRSVAPGLEAMLPIEAPAGTLLDLTRNGTPLSYTTETIKGVTYALFSGGSGKYRATYAPGVNALPGTTSIAPTTVVPGDDAFTLQVAGSGFVPGSVVRWNGTDRRTTFVSASRLEAAIPASDVASSAPVSIRVFTPPPGGGLSNLQTFTIANPVPSIAGLAPDSAATGRADLTLTIDGSGFLEGSVARWDGEDRPTQRVSSRRLTVRIPATDLADAGAIPVTVVNGPPGGGSAAPVTFTVTSPTTLLMDTFSGTAASGWSVSPFSPLGKSEGWSVVNQVYRYDGRGHTQSSNGDVSWADYLFEVSIRLATLNNHPGGIRGRYNPLTGAGYAVWQYPATGRIVLYRVNGWNIDSAGLTELGVANGIRFDTKFHELGISFSGPSISVYRDGAPIISATDSTYSRGLVALDVSDQIVEFDNVVVKR